jgi:hypothetical protein
VKDAREPRCTPELRGRVTTETAGERVDEADVHFDRFRHPRARELHRKQAALTP